MSYWDKNYVHMARRSCIRRLNIVILKKQSDKWDIPMIELTEMVEKHNSLIAINDGTYFVFWDISFKVWNNACIMPSFGREIVSSIFTQCF